jgi:hypothetical protein
LAVKRNIPAFERIVSAVARVVLKPEGVPAAFKIILWPSERIAADPERVLAGFQRILWDPQRIAAGSERIVAALEIIPWTAKRVPAAGAGVVWEAAGNARKAARIQGVTGKLAAGAGACFAGSVHC